MVPGSGRDRRLQPQLGEALLPGRQLLALQQHDPAQMLTGAVVHSHPLPVLHRPPRIARQAQAHVKHPGGRHAAGADELIATLQVVLAEAGDIEAHAARRGHLVHVLPVDLDAARPRARPSRCHLQLLIRADAPPDQRSGYHGTEALEAEGAIDLHARRANDVARSHRRGCLVQALHQRLDTGTRAGGGHHHRRLREHRPFERRGDVHPDQLQHLRIDQVGLGDDDDAARHLEHFQDGEVLAGLGHDALVGGDDKQEQVDAGGAREHVLDEALVARDIHDPGPRPPGQPEPRKPQVDGEPALLLLAQPVGVDSREALHQRGLAVVDMARSADDQIGGVSGTGHGECQFRSRAVASLPEGRGGRRQAAALSSACRRDTVVHSEPSGYGGSHTPRHTRAAASSVIEAGSGDETGTAHNDAKRRRAGRATYAADTGAPSPRAGGAYTTARSPVVICRSPPSPWGGGRTATPSRQEPPCLGSAPTSWCS